MAIAVGSIALLTILYLLLPMVFERFIGYSDLVKVGISIVLIAPLGISMGMLFPLGLKHVASNAPDFVTWAWGINGFASVISAVPATLLAIEFGFVLVLMVALASYAIAASILSSSARTMSPSPLRQ